MCGPSPTDDEIDVELRSARDIGTRMVGLASLLRRFEIEHSETAITSASTTDLDDAASEWFDLNAWLVDEAIVPLLTDDELALLRAEVGAFPVDQDRAADWAAETLVTIAWTAGLGPIPSQFDRSSDPSALLAIIPEPWTPVAPWIDGLQLRSDEDVARERERAEVWLWRLATEPEVRRANAKERERLTRLVRATATECSLAGLWDVREGDAVIDTTRVADLNQDVLDFATSIAHARLHALNWAAGFGPSWSDVPLDI